LEVIGNESVAGNLNVTGSLYIGNTNVGTTLSELSGGITALASGTGTSTSTTASKLAVGCLGSDLALSDTLAVTGTITSSAEIHMRVSDSETLNYDIGFLSTKNATNF
jgi:hypothetical protein